MMVNTMKPALLPRARLLLPLALMLLATHAYAGKPKLVDHWVSSWATAPYALANATTTFGAQDETFRETVHTTLAGPLARVEFTNEFGTEPLTLGAVHLALAAGGGDIALTSANALTFNGNPSITIPPGAIVVSDPAAIAIPAGGDVEVSIFVPAQAVSTVTYHSSAYTTSYRAPGNVVGQKSLTGATHFTSWYFLKALDVKTTGDTSAVVAFGDSITDGAYATVDGHATWPDGLAARLRGNKKTRNLAVLNEGIGGNRVLHDNTGASALKRFNSDVLALPGVQYLVILEGINDIGHAADPVKPYDIVTAEDIIQGIAQMAERAHEHNIKVYGATLTPYVGAKYASPAGEAMRKAVNAWVRTSKVLDGFIDFDKATQDPANPDVFKAAYDHGDHLHPGDVGYKAMADSIDLKLFEPGK